MTDLTHNDPPDDYVPTTAAQRHYLETLFRTSYKNLLNYTRCVGATSLTDAEDIVGHVFQRLAAGHPCLATGDDKYIRDYIHSTIAGLIKNRWRNTNVDHYHREHNTDAVQAVVGPSPTPTPDAIFAATELTERLERIIARLSPQQSQIVRLARQGYTYAEIAKSLGISVSTVNTHMTRALKRIRPELRDDSPNYIDDAEAIEDNR